MASEQMQQLSEMIRASRQQGAAEQTVEQQRADMEAMQAGLPIPADVEREDIDVDGVRCRWVDTPATRPDRVLVYFHGGGYVIGSLDTHLELMQRLARRCRVRVLGVDYRLAPEHPWPAAVDDALTVLSWLRRTRPDARIAIGGDSAGGGLSMAMLVRLRALGAPMPAAAVLFSAWTDLTASQPSHRDRLEVEPMITPAGLARMAHHYAGAAAPTHPELSPLFAALDGMPPLLVQVGDHELLLDDSRQLAERARAAGVEVRLRVFEGAFHVFQAMPALPEAAEALDDVADFLDAHLG